MFLTKTQLQPILKVFDLSTIGVIKEFKTRMTQLLNELQFSKRGGRTNFIKVITFVVEKQIDQLHDQIIQEDLIKTQKQIINASNFKETRQKIVRLQHFNQYEIDELQEQIDLHRDQTVRDDDDNYRYFESLLFTKLQEDNEFRQAIINVRQGNNHNEIVQDHDDESLIYYDNIIVDMDGVSNFIDVVYPANNRIAFKIQFLFGKL